AEGVGLYRTEFEYLSQAALPDEEELAERYGAVVESCPQDGVVFLVLDVGGDKYPPSLSLAHEENPFLGLRGLRLFLRHEDDVAMPQFRAIMRAARKGKVKILYPMVAGWDDLESALDLAERARSQLEEEGFDVPDIDHGIMLEVPSAVHMLSDLLERVDFASVGTNDLVQYALAADRNSERMADDYDPYHPAVLRILAYIRRVGHEAGKPVSICGESAADTHFLPVLLGLGYHRLSVNVGSVPFVKRAIRQVALDDCRELAERVLAARTRGDIHDMTDAFYDENLSDDN
ncbi:MAG: putative PEP-binding protein, partial [Planctomycetota bacterium]